MNEPKKGYRTETVRIEVDVEVTYGPNKYVKAHAVTTVCSSIMQVQVDQIVRVRGRVGAYSAKVLKSRKHELSMSDLYTKLKRSADAQLDRIETARSKHSFADAQHYSGLRTAYLDAAQELSKLM